VKKISHYECKGVKIVSIDPIINNGYPKTVVKCGYRFDSIEIKMSRFPNKMKCPHCLENYADRGMVPSLADAEPVYHD